MRMQTAGEGGFSKHGGVASYGAGAVDPTWSSVDVASVVGAASAGVGPRAVLPALLWPNPCDTHCPTAFKEAARARLPYRIRAAAPRPVAASTLPRMGLSVTQPFRDHSSRPTSRISAQQHPTALLATLLLTHQACGYVKISGKDRLTRVPRIRISGISPPASCPRLAYGTGCRRPSSCASRYDFQSAI